MVEADDWLDDIRSDLHDRVGEKVKSKYKAKYDIAKKAFVLCDKLTEIGIDQRYERELKELKVALDLSPKLFLRPHYLKTPYDENNYPHELLRSRLPFTFQNHSPTKKDWNEWNANLEPKKQLPYIAWWLIVILSIPGMVVVELACKLKRKWCND